MQNVVTEPAGAPGTRNNGTRTLSLFCDISVLVFCHHKGYNIQLKQLSRLFRWEGARGQIPGAIIYSKDFQFLVRRTLCNHRMFVMRHAYTHITHVNATPSITGRFDRYGFDFHHCITQQCPNPDTTYFRCRVLTSQNPWPAGTERSWWWLDLRVLKYLDSAVTSLTTKQSNFVSDLQLTLEYVTTCCCHVLYCLGYYSTVMLNLTFVRVLVTKI